MIDYLDENTRIKLGFKFTALGVVFKLQRKRWYGWKTTSWIYPLIVKKNTYEYIVNWLEWKEKEDSFWITDRIIGKRIMENK